MFLLKKKKTWRAAYLLVRKCVYSKWNLAKVKLCSMLASDSSSPAQDPLGVSKRPLKGSFCVRPLALRSLIVAKHLFILDTG